jgi:hypothetical protein
MAELAVRGPKCFAQKGIEFGRSVVFSSSKLRGLFKIVPVRKAKSRHLSISSDRRPEGADQRMTRIPVANGGCVLIEFLRSSENQMFGV